MAGGVRRLLRRVRRTAGTSLDHVIPPEIKNDRLYAAVAQVASTPGVRHMLEIGSSSGAGSTEAFIDGALANPECPQLHCLEVSARRYAALVKRHANHGFVHCYQASSVAIDDFASAAEVARFHRDVDSKLRAYSLAQVLEWRSLDMSYVTSRDVPTDGIRMIKEQHAIDTFDAVLIDGSEFTAQAELREVYGARFILLDDICTFKNHANFRALSQDPDYRLAESADEPRNGYALFALVTAR